MKIINLTNFQLKEPSRLTGTMPSASFLVSHFILLFVLLLSPHSFPIFHANNCLKVSPITWNYSATNETAPDVPE